MVVRQTVDSSDVASVGYDEETQELEVTFHKTGTYTYLDVPPQKFAELMAAPSKGRYINLELKQARWPYRRGPAGGTGSVHA